MGSIFGNSSGNFFGYFAGNYLMIFFHNFFGILGIPLEISLSTPSQIQNLPTKMSHLKNDKSIDIDIDKSVSKILPV